MSLFCISKSVRPAQAGQTVFENDWDSGRSIDLRPQSQSMSKSKHTSRPCPHVLSAVIVLEPSEAMRSCAQSDDGANADKMTPDRTIMAEAGGQHSSDGTEFSGRNAHRMRATVFARSELSVN